MIKPISVFYEGQDDLIEVLATSIASVCYNTKSFINFYILDCGICELNKKLLETLKHKFDNFTIEYIPMDLKKFSQLKGYTEKNYVDCYSRLLIPELKPELDKAIYLDVDIILMDDIKKLWDEDLKGYELGACADLGYQKFIQTRCVEQLGISKEQIYLNAGVLLLDIKQWKKNRVSDQLFKIAEKYKAEIVYVCEDILNLYYNHNKYKLLPLRYNLHQLENFIHDVCAPNITDDYVNEEWKKIVVLHLSPAKPWRIGEYRNEDLKYFSCFWFFSKMTPFYEGLALRFNNNSNKTMLGVTLGTLHGLYSDLQKKVSDKCTKEKIKLFNFLPLLTVKHKNKTTKYKLFGFIPFCKKKGK